MNDILDPVVANTKAMLTLAAGMIGGGLSLLLGLIPSEDLGKLATLVGLVVSLYVIRRARAEALKLELEIEIMQERREDDRRRRASARGDDLSSFGRVVESLEGPPSNRPGRD